jgi:hypothetical protein
MLLSKSVEAESRCLPAKTRRRSEVGRLVRRARSDRRVDMEVADGMVRGITIVALVRGSLVTLGGGSEIGDTCCFRQCS